MLEVWLNPGSWTHEQWLVFSILGFVIVAVLYMAWRLLKLLRSTSAPRQRPNLRAGRRPGGR